MDDISIVGCDPGLDVFGLSAVQWNTTRKTFKFLFADSIEAPAGDTTISRSRVILKDMKRKTEGLPGKVIYVIEKPPECLYGLKQERVNGVLKLFSITYAVIGALAERDHLVYTIYPQDWQPGKVVLKNLRMDVKRWSRMQAMAHLERLRVKRKLKAGEQDIADSINVCLYGVNKLHRGEWVL